MPAKRQSGGSLVELLIAISIWTVCLTFPVVSLAAALNPVESRGAAQGWQAMGARAQIGSLWQGGSYRLKALAGEIRLVESGEETGASEASSSAEPPTTNVPYWVTDDGVAVTFTAPFGTPNGAGSVSYGDDARGSRVVVRAESGLTRRAKP